MVIEHIFPILIDLGAADEHDIQHDTAATFPIPAGGVVNLGGLWGISTQQIQPGERGTIKLVTSGRKLECTFTMDGDVASGATIWLDRKTGIAGLLADTADTVSVMALPRMDTYRDVSAVNAAARSTDPTITVVLDPYLSTSDKTRAVSLEFTGAETL